MAQQRVAVRPPSFGTYAAFAAGAVAAVGFGLALHDTYRMFTKEAAQTPASAQQPSTPAAQTPSAQQPSTPAAQTSTTGEQPSAPVAQTSATGEQPSAPTAQTPTACPLRDQVVLWELGEVGDWEFDVPLPRTANTVGKMAEYRTQVPVITAGGASSPWRQAARRPGVAQDIHDYEHLVRLPGWLTARLAAAHTLDAAGEAAALAAYRARLVAANPAAAAYFDLIAAERYGWANYDPTNGISAYDLLLVLALGDTGDAATAADVLAEVGSGTCQQGRAIRLAQLASAVAHAP